MKRSTPSASAPASIQARAQASAAARAGLLDDAEIEEIERASPNGLTSRQIVDVFETRGIRFSEATLRKYVQLGLLPRSVRVGRKGKHRGSCGLYPAAVIRRVNTVKGMMAEDRTIEEIQRSFARFKDDIDSVQKDLRELIAGFEREAKAPLGQPEDADSRRAIEHEIIEAKKAAAELVRRISSLERSISARAADSSADGTAVGGGSDLY
ncbi:MAG TPA: MerR family transcriptional regulator [Polyangia bacterium]|nr:MerR family transcriptional regulator [Polyangia bacterium]